jgi:hypothetical protein
VSGGGEFLFPGGATVIYPTGSVTIQGGTPVTPTPSPVTISTTPQNNYPLPAGGVVVLNPTVPVTITGFTPAVPNQTITLVNTGTVPITIPNADPGSSTPNQVKPPWGGPIIIPPNGGMVQLQAGGGAGGGWGVLNPGPMPVLWTAPSPVIPVGGNLNDFNPGGFGIIPLDPQGGNWNLTGLQAQFPGAHLTITVPATATGTITLTDSDPASSLGDQLSLAAGNVTLHPGESLDLTAGAGGDFGTTTSLNGPAVTGGAGTLTHDTGTTTAAFVQVFDVTNADGFHGSINVRNNGGLNGMQYKLTMTDMYNNVTSITTTLAIGIISAVDLDSVIGGNSFPPYKELKLEVKDSTAGFHTTYDVYRAFVG